MHRCVCLGFQCDFISLALSFLVNVLSVCVDLRLVVYFKTKRSEMLSHKAKNYSQRMSTREVTVSQDSYPRLLEEFILSLRKLRFTTNPIGFSKLQLEKHSDIWLG